MAPYVIIYPDRNRALVYNVSEGEVDQVLVAVREWLRGEVSVLVLSDSVEVEVHHG